MHHRSKLLSVSGLALTMSVLPGLTSQVWAQENEDDSVRLGTITVRSTKVEKSLQDVPISVTALSAEDLALRGVNNVQEIGFSAPNVTILDQSGSTITNINIRGIGGRAGVYVDEIFVSAEAGFADAFLDVETVEILRGPQGTLFGRNTIAGAISIYTAKPSEEFSGAASIEVGDFNTVRVKGTIGGGLANGVSGKLSAVYSAHDGFVENAIGPDLNDEDRIGVRGQLRFEPSEALDIILTADYYDRDESGFAWDALPFGTTPLDSVPGSGRDREVALNAPSTSTSETNGLSARVEYDFDWATLTSISAYRDSTSSLSFDADYLPVDALVTGLDTDTEEVTQEIRLNGATDRLDWLVGLYYFDRQQDTGNDNFIGGDIPFDGTLLGFPPGLVNNLTELSAAAGLSSPPVPVLGSGTNNRENVAIFGSVTFAITDALDFTIGGRYTEETLEGSIANTTPQPDWIPLLTANFSFEDFAGERSDSNFSPTVSAVYRFSDNVSGYATYSEGFAGGGFNFTRNAVDDGAARDFAPETVQNYEAGVKTVLFDDRLRLNAAVFQMNYEDIQIAVTRDGFSFIGNAGEAEITGAEVEFVAALSDHLEVSAGLGVQDAEYKSGELAFFGDLDGNKLVSAPDMTGNLGVQYTSVMTRYGRFQLGVSVQQLGERFLSFENFELSRDPSVTTTNANIGWTDPSERYSVTLRGLNLTDEAYLTNLDPFGFAGAPGVTVSDPSQVTIELKATF